MKNGAPNVYGDNVDERGFVDGVKVARKMSKANVLGKATEYIRYVFPYLTTLYAFSNLPLLPKCAQEA